MANGVGKHKLLVIGPTEPWSVREKLCLATSVMKSGDQNWVSVSRAIKPFAESGRPPDWFSQKHCASKYSELLETTEAPKRKRGEKGEVVETVEDVIVRKLTADRIDELKRLIKETQEEHRRLKSEAELIQAGHKDSKLQELWEEILQKKKLEGEEAELKRTNTDAAYQARQAARNTPKRLPGIATHSPSGRNSPGQDFSPSDPLDCLTPDLPSPRNINRCPHSRQAPASARLMTIPECSGPGGDDVVPGSLLDDLAQKKLQGQRATPPPSPLLSELLKKGSLLATNSRLIGEGDGNMTAAHDLQLTLPSQPISQATGAPMLSRLLEAGPSQFSAPFSGAPFSAASPIPVHTNANGSTEVDVTVPSVAPGCHPVSSEEDVTVSYMGDELDLKTVGDIIAIIEDKADETGEALDAAAVEAALSLCEENGHALSGAWGPSALHGGLEAGKTQALEVQGGGTSTPLSSLCDGPDDCLSAFPAGLRGLAHATSSSSRNSNSLELCHTRAPEATMRETGQTVHQESPISSSDVTVKCDREKWAQQIPDKPYGDSVLEDSPLTQRHPKEMRAGDGMRENASGIEGHGEVANGPDVCGGGGGGGEDEEEEEEEGFLSEPDGDTEPAASESEDGYSLRTASSSLQLHTTADSIPSSPASSLFSVCSEDLEALQAHKIWKKAIMLVWRAAANHRYANVFLQPVTDEIAPGYRGIVHRPMDLAAIKKSIETGLIRTTAEFQRDVMLMFQNAVMYNGLDHDVHHMALEMQRDVLEQVQQFLATQLIMETAEATAGIGAKSLRGREGGARRQDPADKDSVSMSSPAFLLSLFDGGTRGRRCAIEADLKMKK